MKILRISKRPLPENVLRTFSDFGMMVTDLPPTLLSAMTSMKIAKATKKDDYDVVMVDSLDNAMAAVSARKLHTGHDYKTVFCVPPNADVPKSVPKDIAMGVDGWIFSSQRLLDLYPGGLSVPVVVTPVSLAGIQLERPSAPHPVPIIGWIGDIIYPEGLRTALEEVDALHGHFILHIAGAGQAKAVMPLVRLSRSLVHKDNVEWIGEGYDVAREMAKCDAVLYTAPDLTVVETIAVQNEIPVIEPSEIGAFLEGSISHNPDFDLSAATYLSDMRARLLYVLQHDKN